MLHQPKISVDQWIVDRLGIERCQRILREVKTQHDMAGLPDSVARSNALSVLENEAASA